MPLTLAQNSEEVVEAQRGAVAGRREQAMSEGAEAGIVIGGGGEAHAVPQQLLLGMANRHGLIAGATGTGKTITLQILAEQFSDAGVPVFLSDVKGDVSGMAAPGSAEARTHEPFMARAATIGIALGYRAMPVTFWDLFGEQGHPVRATVAEMGPLLLSRLLGLTDVQEGVLNVAFRVADEQGLPLLDMADLTALLQWCGQNAKELSLSYGNVTTASVGAIQRALLVLENQGGRLFFGEPALELADLMGVTPDGRGMVNILAADRLMQSPRLYATFLLWLLSELFEALPEVGNPEKPRLVFFFDEAHLLFTDAPKALVAKVEQVARLIRSKGVGVFFITQNPADVPDSILAQLGNRVQHALRAFTAKDRKDLEKAAQTYRDNPRFATVDAIRDVGTGEAVTSMLDRKGVPQVVERTLIRPPASQVGPLDPAARAEIIAASALGVKYAAQVDRDSAREILARRAAEAAGAAAAEEELNRARRYEGGRAPGGPAPVPRGSSRQPKGLGEALAEAAVKELSGTTGRRIVRGILGGMFRGR
jgi:DNA helicase HerA-like ATPase